MKKHPDRLRKAGISPARYAELKAVCRQYQEYRRRVRSPGALRRLRIIEACAEAVAVPAVARAIIRCATEGTCYEHIRPPIGRNQFYALVLRFYVELDRVLWEEK